MQSKPLQKLLERELTRKQFIQVLFMLIIGSMGLSAITGLLSQNEKPKAPANPGYGKQSYGP